MIELKDISFSYGETAIFKDLNMAFPTDSRTAILGRSGLGKTTLIHIITGLLRPNSGTVSGVTTGPIGMVFQEDRLIPSLSIFENLSVTTDASPEEIGEMLELLGLAETGSMALQELSGGMARRTSIARALLAKTDLLIMDEPFKGLDSTTLSSVADAINRFSQGKTLIIITHSPSDATLLGCECTNLDELI